MKRRLFTIFSVLSLLLFLATATLWIRSKWYEDRWVFPNERIYYGVYSQRGVIEFSWASRSYYWPPLKDKLWSFAGFSILHGDLLFWGPSHGPLQNDWGYDGPGGQGYLVGIPYWFLTLLSSPLPLYWIVNTRRRRRVMRTGLCSKCGYDLRASKERCPECGTTIAHTPAAPHTGTMRP